MPSRARPRWIESAACASALNSRDDDAEHALRVVLGWSLPEAEAATGIPLNTVRSRVRLAKNALRAAVEADPMLAAGLDRRGE